MEFQFPAINAEMPIWDGQQFKLGDRIHKVLEYNTNLSGWNDDLTAIYEEEAGKNHFMSLASQNHTLYQLNKYLKKNKPTILEIGCSSGYMLQRIVNERTDALVMGSDIVYQPLLNLAEKMPNIPLMRFDLTQCPLPDACCDAVVILNVLEHIEDDQKALNEIYRVLKPGAIVIIEVPAGPHLYDVYDKALMHFRRYTMADLITKIKKAGFNIERKSHLGFFLYPGFAFVKKRNQRFLSLSIEEQRKMALNNSDDTSGNKLFHALMKLEFGLGKWVRYPWGIRCLTTCRK